MARTSFNRNYLCIYCGSMRRAPANYVKGHIKGMQPTPKCCQRDMHLLSYEQTVATSRLTLDVRLKWFRAGARIRKVGGKRQWRPSKHLQ